MIRRWPGRGRHDAGGPPPQHPPAGGLPDGPQPPGELDLLLAQTIARHFAGASTDGAVVRPGFGNLEIECLVHEPARNQGQWSAPLFLHLSGGRLGTRPLFASVSGYHRESAAAAVVEGACLWSCSFGPVLASGLTGAEDPGVTHDEVTVAGRRWRLVHNHLDRAMTGPGVDPEPLAAEVRARLGGRPHLTPQVLAAVPGGLLTQRDASLLSVFVMEGMGRRTVEVKVNGVDTRVDWPAAAPPPSGVRGLALLRELALLVPLGEPAQPLSLPGTLDRPSLTAILARQATQDAPGQVAGWRGWRTHGGQPGPVLPAGRLAQLESSIGPLPGDFRRFLGDVAGPGAGPGYGLLPPRRIGDEIPLAQAGCNAVWVLKVGGGDYGSVWVNSIPLDGRRRRVAGSFTAWYRDWLGQAAANRGAWTHWSQAACVTTGMLRQLTEEHGGRRPRTAAGLPDLSGVLTQLAISGWNEYLPPLAGDALIDPCQGCAEILAHHNVPEDVIAPGALSRGGSGRRGPGHRHTRTTP